jgi:DNA-binding response OmpR family regulator
MKCPCCGQDTDDESLDLLKWVKLSPGERRVMDILLSAHPRRLTNARIADLMWTDDPTGGPEGGSAVVRVHLRRIRKKIAHLGWTAGVGSAGFGIGLSRIVEARREAA